MNENFNFKPIGFYKGPQSEKYSAGKQAEFSQFERGKIVLNPSMNFEMALEDLKGFSKIWLIYCFHRNNGWKPKIMTPRGGIKRGVFATRSPHRPNPIGLSAVDLIEIKGRSLIIGKSDLIEGTPILDIKPYVIYADAFTDVQQGWLNELEHPRNHYEIKWSKNAMQQADWIEKYTGLQLTETVHLRLSENPLPFPGHRIKKLPNGTFELAFKAWRLNYFVQEQVVAITHIYSGYALEALSKIDPEEPKDILLHRTFTSIEWPHPLQSNETALQAFYHRLFQI